MTDVTQILSRIEKGDPSAAGKLLPLVYDELRKFASAKLANEKPGQTLQATALVHEAYLRLVKDGDSVAWASRGHFFASAAEAMRRILVESARRKQSQKAGGEFQRIELDASVLRDRRSEKLIAMDESLARLEAQDATKAELVKLRFFAGLTGEQAAAALEISTSTADRYWAYARAWLQRDMQAE